MKHSPTPIGHYLIVSSLVSAVKLETTKVPRQYMFRSPDKRWRDDIASVCGGHNDYVAASIPKRGSHSNEYRGDHRRLIQSPMVALKPAVYSAKYNLRTTYDTTYVQLSTTRLSLQLIVCYFAALYKARVNKSRNNLWTMATTNQHLDLSFLRPK